MALVRVHEQAYEFEAGQVTLNIVKNPLRSSAVQSVSPLINIYDV
jgi:hypothetical protein